MSGICIGLLLTLLALVVQISCQTDCKQSSTQRPSCNSEGSWSDSDSDTTSDLSVRRQRQFERTLNMNVFTSAEELERAQRLEERERIIREIWMNGQPDIPGTRSLNRYYWWQQIGLNSWGLLSLLGRGLKSYSRKAIFLLYLFGLKNNLFQYFVQVAKLAEGRICFFSVLWLLQIGRANEWYIKKRTQIFPPFLFPTNYSKDK